MSESGLTRNSELKLVPAGGRFQRQGKIQSRKVRIDCLVDCDDPTLCVEQRPSRISEGIDRVVENSSAGLCRHPGLCDHRLDQTPLCKKLGNLIGGGRGKLEQLSSYIIWRSGSDQTNATRITDRNECLAGVHDSLAQLKPASRRPAALYRAQDRAAVVIGVLNF